MAIKQGSTIQMPGVFVTMAVFFLAYSTMLVASHKPKQAEEKPEVKQMDGKPEVDSSSWDKSLSSDPEHPWYKQPLPPKPHDSFYLYAKSCLDDLNDEKCVKQIFGGILRKAKLDDGCGCKVKKMGRICLMAVSGTTGHMKKYENDADRINKRANRIFNSEKLSKCPEK